MKKIIKKKEIKFLEKYLNNPSPTGFESKGQEIWMEYLKPYVDNFMVDDYGSVAGIIRGTGKDGYKVVIEGHADEIGFFVNYITSDGYLYLTRNGGSDHQIAPSKRVVIHGRKGDVTGVFGWPAIHTRYGGKEEQKPTMKNIFLDVGAKDKAEVHKMGIYVGAPITYPDKFMVMNKKYFVGRALDNRAGGFMIAQVARLLKENEISLPYDLYIVNSVQEEIGLRGAQMMAQTIKPNAAIVTDVTHDTNTPMINKVVEGDINLGDGGVIARGAAVQNELYDLIIKQADYRLIDYGLRATSRSTGTDTDAFAYNTPGGCPSALISLPLRYMHTTVEMCAKKDMESVIELIYYTLQEIEENHDFRYIKGYKRSL